MKTMSYKQTTRYGFAVVLAGCLSLLLGVAGISAQEKVEPKASTAEKSGRDPFKKFQPAAKAARANASVLNIPTIQERIERYRAVKMAAASAHVAAPKPTTALLLSELQVVGIFRTPRGWAAMVEATPLKPTLSYVIYPGESFFDGQLVAIEENRLIFRREIVWTDGRREKSVEIKPLRQPSPVETMTARTTASGPTNGSSEKSTAQEKQ